MVIPYQHMMKCINTKNSIGALMELRVLMDSTKETERMPTMVMRTPSAHTMIYNNIRSSIGVKMDLLRKLALIVSFKPILKNKALFNSYFNNIDPKANPTLMTVTRTPFLNMTI